MARKTVIRFPIFAPIPTTIAVTTTPTTTEVHFSRWNNSNADKFNQHRRTQQQIEDDLRRHRRFESALNIANIEPSASTPPSNFKSSGTPSAPSRPSIPGKKSMYSKQSPNPNSKPSSDDHPAFQKVLRKSKLPQNERDRELGEASLKVGEDGLSYVVAGAPFEFKYSYTETPKVKPVALREPPVVAFGLPPEEAVPGKQEEAPGV